MLLVNEGKVAATQTVAIVECNSGEIGNVSEMEPRIDIDDGRRFLSSHPVNVYLGLVNYIGSFSIDLPIYFKDFTITIIIGCIEAPAVTYQRTMNYDEWLEILAKRVRSGEMGSFDLALFPT